MIMACSFNKAVLSARGYHLTFLGLRQTSVLSPAIHLLTRLVTISHMSPSPAAYNGRGDLEQTHASRRPTLLFSPTAFHQITNMSRLAVRTQTRAHKCTEPSYGAFMRIVCILPTRQAQTIVIQGHKNELVFSCLAPSSCQPSCPSSRYAPDRRTHSLQVPPVGRLHCRGSHCYSQSSCFIASC